MEKDRIDLTATLERTALLSSLSQTEIQSLAMRTVRKHFATGELLFSEDEPCHGLHIIARGKVRIFKTSVNGREQVRAGNQAGESVAELPVFDGGRYPAAAIAIDDVDLAFISRQDFQARAAGFNIERFGGSFHLRGHGAGKGICRRFRAKLFRHCVLFPIRNHRKHRGVIP